MRLFLYEYNKAYIYSVSMEQFFNHICDFRETMTWFHAFHLRLSTAYASVDRMTF